MKRVLHEVSGVSNRYPADAGEPDTGWLPGGDARTLGFESGKPEPWFHQGAYEQVNFPVADFIFGSKKEDKKYAMTVQKSAPVQDLGDILKELDAEIESIKDSTAIMYDDLKRR